MSSTLTYTTALCLIPPENVWKQIQSIRSIYDRAYPRWMPHINLLFPFVPESEFGYLKRQLDGIFKQTKPFEIEFDQTSFNYFKQGDQCSFHLRPKISKDIIEIEQLLQKYLPNYISNEYPFEAHLTLGQAPISRISNILNEIKFKWKPIRFPIDRIYMISRENDPNDLFSIKNQVFLGGLKDIELIYTHSQVHTQNHHCTLN